MYVHEQAGFHAHVQQAQTENPVLSFLHSAGGFLLMLSYILAQILLSSVQQSICRRPGECALPQCMSCQPSFAAAWTHKCLHLMSLQARAAVRHGLRSALQQSCKS